MPIYDASDAECLVFTFKDGLLSRVAHDLELRVASFTVDVADDLGAVTAAFDPRSLEVLHAMKRGRANPSALSDKDKQTIRKNIQTDVLQVDRYPEIRFTSSEIRRDGADLRIQGSLTLHGTTRSIQAVGRAQGDRLVVEVELHQPDFGVTPYSAMLGTLKVKPHVKVRLSVPRASRTT